ncbi:hypothetical protein HK405_012786 [Cladochytrium tenue]|nr:hypothetical protein HK405_012786 [Cladochytrium tenue]
MNIRSVLLALLAVTGGASATTYFKETFDGESVPARWVQSQAKADYGLFDVTAGKFYADEVVSRGLRTSQDARFYSISAPLDEAFDNKGKDLVIQFTAKFEQNIDCGGGYIKVLPEMDPTAFNGDTEYSVMFGPDICGYDKKVHAILSYKGKNHLIKKKINPGSDQLTHQYTLVLHPDQTYEILVDNKEEASGSILDDWDLLPPKTIKDPEAKKPADWVDAAMIPDPEDTKPDDWEDLPEFISDPEAEQPEDWDEDMDGDWEAPKIKNPDYQGEWKPKQIKNPDYNGPWVHPEIPNPEYGNLEDPEIGHFTTAHVGFDLWQVKAGTIFDNIIVTDTLAEAQALSKATFEEYAAAEKSAKDVLDEKEKAGREEKAEADKAADEESAAAEEDELEEVTIAEADEPEVETKAAPAESSDDDEDDEEEEEIEEKASSHDEL